MGLLEQIVGDLNESMKARDTVRTGTLRMVKAALMNRKIEAGHELAEPEIQATLTYLIKQRKDSVEQFSLAGRMELASKEESEFKIIENYLPPALSDADIDRIEMVSIEASGA